jgi:hypothetical protein
MTFTIAEPCCEPGSSCVRWNALLPPCDRLVVMVFVCKALTSARARCMLCVSMADGGVTMGVTRAQLMDAMVKLAGEGSGRFQSRDLRRVMGVEASDRTASAALHNLLRALNKEGVIAVAPGDRRRNRYYRLVQSSEVDEPRVDNQVVKRAASSAPDRLTRIETALERIEQRLTRVEGNLGDLLVMWK